ncbi:MAG: DUF2905 domain-containing protein [Alphaproteobacteria bacterium]|nr:MAG: DUF2905 domain-containing protein [Alphaproteobacteria bacterium]
MSKFLITLGLILIALGLLWPLAHKLGLGRLPGDLMFERDGVRIYVPLATSLVISVVLSLLFWLINR